MAKLRISGDSSGYVDLEAPNAASSSTLDLDQVPQKNVANTFSADISFGDNNKVNLGAGNDLQLYHDGSNNYIKSVAAGWLNVPLSGNGMTVANSNFSNIFFKIDSSGRVVTPNQPAFWATSSTYAATGNYPFTNFNISGVGRFNTGSHLNLTSGVFTAPVAGKYQFNGAFHSNSASTTARRIGRFQLNGNSLGEFMESSAQYADIGASIIVNMSANDTMQMITHPLNFDGVDFSGFLIG
jgi:hypothetical protein